MKSKNLKIGLDNWKRIQKLKIDYDFTRVDGVVSMLFEIATPERIKEWAAQIEKEANEELRAEQAELNPALQETRPEEPKAL